MHDDAAVQPPGEGCGRGSKKKRPQKAVLAVTECDTLITQQLKEDMKAQLKD